MARKPGPAKIPGVNPGAMPPRTRVPMFASAMGVAVDGPRIVRDASELQWDDEADLVVVGLGGAGIAAALEGVENGLEVAALDRFAQGGSTAANGGVIYAGGGTAIQKEAGVDDTKDAMLAYLEIEEGEVISRETLERFVDGSAETIDWIMGHGGEFEGSYWPQKASYPPLDKFLYHPDNTLVARYREEIPPAPRGHRAFATNGDKAWGLGGFITRKLEAAALQRGLRLHKYAQATRLVQDETGRVIGVEGKMIPADSKAASKFAKHIAAADKWMAALPPSFPLSAVTMGLGRRALKKAFKVANKAGEPFRVHARKGVQISCGGFVINRRMLAHFAPQFLRSMPNGTLGDDGSGILLGASVGGNAVMMDRISAWRFINPPKAWSDSIIVNREGARFVDETVYGATLGDLIAVQPGGKAWLIYDKPGRKAAFEQARDEKLVPFQKQVTLLNLLFNKVKGRTLGDLARKLGMPAEALEATVAEYNEAAYARAPDPLGKTSSDMMPIEQGPFYAMDASIDSKLLALAIMTVGGLKVDEASGQVLGEDGAPIAGLYAAGRSAIGLCTQTYVSGLSFADCLFSGRRTARHCLGKEIQATSA